MAERGKGKKVKIKSNVSKEQKCRCFIGKKASLKKKCVGECVYYVRSCLWVSIFAPKAIYRTQLYLIHVNICMALLLHCINETTSTKYFKDYVFYVERICGIKCT